MGDAGILGIAIGVEPKPVAGPALGSSINEKPRAGGAGTRGLGHGLSGG
jgi:hypothetical protein